MKYTTTDFLRAATDTAEHFGFSTIEKLRRDPVCQNCPSALSHTICDDDHRLDTHGGVSARTIAAYCEEKLHAHSGPTLLYSLVDHPDETTDTALTLNIFNVPKSIAEAILIQAARSLLNELGENDHIVKVNSLGDNESTARYVKELTNFLRKRLDLMPDDAREKMKQHPMLALQELINQDHELAYKAPSPLEHLSDQSRKHFREIVEYLDLSDAAYEIDPKLLGHHEVYSDALFSIDPLATAEAMEPQIKVRGGRFDEFIYRKTKTRTPAVGVVISQKSNRPAARLPKAKTPPVLVHVVQLGFGPKLRSLMIIDLLKQAGVPVKHDLASDSLSTQLRQAEAAGVRYTIIVGQKEFVDNTVILRDMKERSQEPVNLETLVKRLKKEVVLV